MSARYRRGDSVRVAALENEGVLLHLGTRRYYTVSESALALLEYLAAPRTAQELEAFLLERYELTEEHAVTTVQTFLERCRKADVVFEEGA
ncbi:MAG TPA: PqqD family peptide modification chaperone [Gemmatimonadales bacterium]|nr:PqqD family peptide modification chaperone [Gemmatimonadales bacterium]